MRSLISVGLLVVAGLVPALHGQDTTSREKEILAFGKRVGEIRATLKLTDAAAKTLAPERKKKYDALKQDIETELTQLETDVLGKKVELKAAQKTLDRQENALSGWVAFADAPKASTAKTAPPAGPLGNVPVVVAMSPEDWFAYQLFAPWITEAQKDPDAFRKKLTGVFEQLRKEYPQGIGRKIQQDMLRDIERINGKKGPGSKDADKKESPPKK